MPKASDETPEVSRGVPSPDEGNGGTRWRRFALAAVPGFVAAAVLGGATTQGLLAASFAVSGDSFKMSADQLSGQGFAQHGDVAESVDGSSRPIGLSNIDTAELTNLCMSSLWDLPIGEATLVITAGEDDPVEARRWSSTSTAPGQCRVRLDRDRPHAAPRQGRRRPGACRRLRSAVRHHHRHRHGTDLVGRDLRFPAPGRTGADGQTRKPRVFLKPWPTH